MPPQVILARARVELLLALLFMRHRAGHRQARSVLSPALVRQLALHSSTLLPVIDFIEHYFAQWQVVRCRMLSLGRRLSLLPLALALLGSVLIDLACSLPVRAGLLQARRVDRVLHTGNARSSCRAVDILTRNLGVDRGCEYGRGFNLRPIVEAEEHVLLELATLALRLMPSLWLALGVLGGIFLFQYTSWIGVVSALL